MAIEIQSYTEKSPHLQENPMRCLMVVHKIEYHKLKLGL